MNLHFTEPVMNAVSAQQKLSSKLIGLLALAVGILVANLYYMQPIIGTVAQSLDIPSEISGLVITLTQVGYGLSVLFLVPLGDILENRKLILTMMSITFIGALGVVFSGHYTFFVAALIIGIGASGIQSIVPYVANLSSEHNRGQVVGTIMSGLMMGIMLSRPIASFLTDVFSWQAVFILSSSLIFILIVILYLVLPTRQPPAQKLSYQQLILSMPMIYRDSEVLRRRAIYQSFLFAAFCIFWTAAPLYLLSSTFNFTHTQVAIFALVGVAGAVVAPVSGRLADRGLIRIATFIALIVAILSFVITHLWIPGSFVSIILLGMAAIALDAGVSANLVLGQRAIFSLRSEWRNRLNGLYIAIIFIGGAVGSGLGVWAFEKGGWGLTTLVGLAMPSLAFLYFLTESKDLYSNESKLKVA